VLGDDHPMVAHTMESIEVVEFSKDNSIPSANDLLAKWVSAKDDTEHTEKAMMCARGHNMDRVVDLNIFTSFGWYRRLEDALAGGACGNVSVADDDILSKVFEPPTPKANGSGRFSI
jgi:hypothetical protein